MAEEAPSTMAQTDREALVALYNTTGGAKWKENRNWNTDATLSQWYGVQVSTSGRVVKLELGDNNLQGPIPPELGNVEALEHIDLSFNKLSGHIPPQLGNLSALEHLRLYNNIFDGPIPPELGKLAALQHLDLRYNQLSGPIPPELGNLAALQLLNLSVNQLSGPIPPELGSLGALKKLSLWSNNLNGGPAVKEPLSAWKSRLQRELAERERAERERAERERAERERAERERAERERAERERLERERAERERAKRERVERERAERKRVEQERAELERQEMVLKAGDVGRWLHQDLGFDEDNSATYGASLRARHLHNLKTIFAVDQQTLEAVLVDVQMPQLLASLVMEAWRRRRKEDEDRRRTEAEIALVQARQLADSAAEERRRREGEERSKKKRAEEDRLERERAERERAEEHASLELQRSVEFERQDMARKAGDVGRWLHQDLGFDEDNSAAYGASLRARHLHNPKTIFAVDQQTLEAVLVDLQMPQLLASLVMEAWRRRRQEDEDRRSAESESALIEARQRAALAAEERRRRAEEERTTKELREAEARRREEDEAAKAEAERQRSEAAEREERARREQSALHTPMGRWLKMDAYFTDSQASRFCVDLEELGISSTQNLKTLHEAEQQQLGRDLKMNTYETRFFMEAMQTLRTKPDVFEVSSSTANAGASFVNLMQLRDCGGMATVFTANQLVGGPESTATRPVVLKRSDKDPPAAYLRESRVLQYLSKPGGVAAGFVVQLLEAYSTSDFNFIAMEQGGQNLTARVAESNKLPASEQKTNLALWGQQACQVVVALHGLGIVWGDVKPDNFVFLGDRLVAVDFGSTCVEVGSTAQLELGADADTSFTSSPRDQFAWSVQYAAPERARSDRYGGPCVARRSQDVWSLGMVLYYLSTGGMPYFPSPVERTEAAIAHFREQTQQTLTKDDFRVDLSRVRGSAWRCSLGLALETSVHERGTASEVLEAFARGIRGLVSTVSMTRGMESFQRTLAKVSEDQQEVLRRTGSIAGDVGRVLQQQLDLRRRVTAMSTVVEQLAMDEMRMPHAFLVLPEKQRNLRRPNQWFADRGRLRFVCAHGLELVPCGEDGTGFLVSQPKEWMRKHATLLRVTVMSILAAAAVAGTAASVASGGATGLIATSLTLPFEVIDLDDAYRFLSGVGGEEMDRLLDQISDTLDPTTDEIDVPTNLRGVKEVTGAEYRSVLNFLDTRCPGWDRQMGGVERTLSADGVIGWVCPLHRSEWEACDVKGTSATTRRASISAHGPVRPMPAEPAAVAPPCTCVVS